MLGRAQITLSELQTIIVKIKAILNDGPLTYVSADVEDEDVLTPSTLPHERVDDEEINDPGHGNSNELTKRAKRLALLLQHLRNRWKTGYLTTLRAFQKAIGDKKQTIKNGDIVLLYDDKPRIDWNLHLNTLSKD